MSLCKIAVYGEGCMETILSIRDSITGETRQTIRAVDDDHLLTLINQFMDKIMEQNQKRLNAMN